MSGLFLAGALWPLLLLAPCAWIVLRAFERRRFDRLEAALPAAHRRLLPDLDHRARRARTPLLACGLLCAALAGLEPVLFLAGQDLEPGGSEVRILLDVSRSMLARDVAPSRLSAAKDAVAELAAGSSLDRIGVTAFAGSARLLCPPTSDRVSLAELLEEADPAFVPDGGSDLGAALASVADAVSDGDGRMPVVYLLSDGEDLSRRGLSAAQALAARGIVVHAVGFGSAHGGKIPVESRGTESYLRDAEGKEVVSALDPDGLRAIAEATGGVYLDAASREHPLVALHEEVVRPTVREAARAGFARQQGSAFQWPLLAAILLWILELGWSDRRKP